MHKSSVTQEEISKTHDWSLNDIITEKFSYGELLDMIQAKEWELLQDELSDIRNTYPTYEVEHNLNPLAIFSDLFNLVGRPARALAKEYEDNVWKIHKDSVAQGIYYQDHNNNEPFNLQTTSYPSTLDPILRPAKLMPVLDTEMDNSSAGQSGSLWPCSVFSTNPNQRMFKKKKQLIYGPGDSVFKINLLDRIIGYTMKDATIIVTSMEALALRIKQFLDKYAGIDSEGEYTSPDAYMLLEAAQFLEQGSLPRRFPWSEWGSGGYKPYTSEIGRKEHDAILEEIKKLMGRG